MNRSCDNCKLEFQREHESELHLLIDMEVSGWYADDVKSVCPSCMKVVWNPESHQCKRCGKAIFAAWYRQKQTNFNAAPHHCGYQINYSASRPGRVAMLSRQYWSVDDPDKPNLLYVQHRCKKIDIQRFSVRRYDHEKAITEPAIKAFVVPARTHFKLVTNNAVVTSSWATGTTSGTTSSTTTLGF